MKTHQLPLAAALPDCDCPPDRARAQDGIALQILSRHAGPLRRKGERIKARPLLAAAALALASASPATHAATQLGDYFSFSGFGTLGAVRTNNDEGKFGKDRQFGGADKSADFNVDSNLGLQLTGTATPWLSATVQGLLAKRSKDHLEPDIEWAFVTVKPLEGLSIRGGRLAAPVFAISDSRNVGYANTWVRAPNEVYGLNTFDKMEGLDVTYRRSIGSIGLSATAIAGKTTKFKTQGRDAQGKDLKGVNVQLETEWATFRVGQVKANVAIPSFNELGDPYTFTGFGVIVDHDNVVAQAEFVKRRSGHTPDVVDADGWYVMGGYRFGTLLPYAIVSSTRPKTPGYRILLTGEQQTQALGLRWDAFSAAAIKFQVERIDTNGTKGISFTTPATPPVTPRAPPGSKPVTQPVTALSVAVDFMF